MKLGRIRVTAAVFTFTQLSKRLWVPGLGRTNQQFPLVSVIPFQQLKVIQVRALLVGFQ
jgi:hypothetical protein